MLLLELLQLDVGLLKFLVGRLLLCKGMICIVDWNYVVDFRWNVRCREDVVSDFRGAFCQVALGFLTLPFLANTLSEVIFRIDLGVKMTDCLGGRI